MKINLYENRPISFYGNNNPGNPLLDTYHNKYKNSYQSTLIPDLREYIAKIENIKETDIKGIVGEGGLSVIFDIGEGEVLKCSLENPLEFRRHNPLFDIPFLSPVEKFGKTYFVKEVKADTKNMTKKDCIDVIKRMQNAGFETSNDFDCFKTEQIGKYNGKAYLLDSRCARPRPDRFSRFVYNFKKFNNRVYIVNGCSAEEIAKQEARKARRIKLFGPQCLHKDETPRPNLSFKRGLKIMRGVMERNKRFGMPAISFPGVLESLLRFINR